MLKKVFLLLVIIVFTENNFVFSQISSFPYNEGFESTFVTGTNVDFIPNWNGNEVQSSSRIFRDGTNMQTGTGAMAVIPISSFTGVAIVNLSFSSLINGVANFSARSVANGTGTRAAIVNLSVSTDGGSSYSSPTQIGTDTTFANTNTAYANYSFTFPSSTDAQSSVKLKIVVSQGSTGSGTTAQFVMDDFSISGTPYTDTIPPHILSISVASQNTIDVIFSESVEQISAETMTNYTLNGTSNPNAASLTLSNTVHLTFGNNFTSGAVNTLSVLNVKDLNNNAITTASTGQFTYFAPVIAGQYDIIISEIYFQFGSTGLPSAEYVELYNRSSKTFNLDGWAITDANNTPASFGTIILQPESYLILCSTTNVSLLSQFGNVLGIAGFPGLNDDGDDIKIYDNSSVIIDEVNYDASYYNNPDRDGGGYSIERIDTSFICPNNLNWRASEEFLGGTPGKINSVTGTFTDEEAPRLVRAFISAPGKVTGIFSEPLVISDLSNLSNYSINNSIGTPVAVNIISASKVELTVSGTFSPAIMYTLNVNASIKDCPGNTISKTSARFQFPDSADVSDVLINEVLYHPSVNGSEFIELYNNSSKVIDLSMLWLSEVNIDSNTLVGALPIISEPYLIFPEEYVVLTENQKAVKISYITSNIDGFINMPSFPSLNDDEDEFAIADLSAKRIDQLYYNSDFQFPLLNDDAGVSLERISFNRPAQDSSNWHSASEAVGFATPAYENSQHEEVINDGSEVSVEPEIFSPDNDGTNDVVNINYNFGEPGFIANLKIFDSKGREIIHLVKNQLIGISGTFSWDGITGNNQKAKVGIYVAYLEVFNEKGTVKKFKKPVVLASKL